jgi:hypothetical protein
MVLVGSLSWTASSMSEPIVVAVFQKWVPEFCIIGMEKKVSELEAYLELSPIATVLMVRG